MPDPRWQALVESVLTGVEPDAEKRARLKVRLRNDRTTGMLHSCWSAGGNPTEIARILRRLARAKL